MDKFEIDEFKIYLLKVNELIEDYPPKVLPQEELESLETILEEIKNGTGTYKTIELKAAYLSKLLGYISEGFDTSAVYGNYVEVLRTGNIDKTEDNPSYYVLINNWNTFKKKLSENKTALKCCLKMPD